MTTLLFSRVTGLLLAFSAAALLAQEAEMLPNELPWSRLPQARASSGKCASKKRQGLAAMVFPEFVYVGPFQGAIQHLMTESRRFSPDGRTVGSFVLRDVGPCSGHINLRLRGRNFLELVDTLCAINQLNWTLMPHGVLIHREKPTS